MQGQGAPQGFSQGTAQGYGQGAAQGFSQGGPPQGPRHSVYVGNMPYQATEQDIGNFFAQAGNLINVKIVYDRETGRPKGFGFCEYADEAGAQNAINMFNGADFNGRALRVNSANR